MRPKSLHLSRLPGTGPGAMLCSVFGSSLHLGLRRLARWLPLVLAALPSSAFAQQASDSGWFDPPAESVPAGTPSGYDARRDRAPAPAPAPADQPDADPSALTAFRPALDPYGTWVADPKYGTVWVPNVSAVGSDFAPYVSRGHWALTADEDWIWVSDYPFGWAVFHYGRWVWIPASGWAWVPGRTYANAWVVWRVPTAGYAYVGWAPMPPTWGWFGGFAVGFWYWPPLPYVFCPSAYAFHYDVHHYVVHDRDLMHRVAAGTKVYRTPARPGIRSASAGSHVAPTAVPRGPGIAAARVPASAVPVARTAPPPPAVRLAPVRPSAGPSDLTRSRVVPADVTRHRVGADALPRSSTAVRPPADLRREPAVQPPRFGAEQPRLRPMPPPMRDFVRSPAPAPRSRRP